MRFAPHEQDNLQAYLPNGCHTEGQQAADGDVHVRLADGAIESLDKSAAR